MAAPVRITIKNTVVGEVDAPTVEDLLSQIQDLVDVLRSVEVAIAENGNTEIDWRVTEASSNSPIRLEITPFPRQHAMSIDRRAGEVAKFTVQGLRSLTERADRPTYFNDATVDRAERVFQRLTNGLEATVVDFSEYIDDGEVSLDNTLAVRAMRNVEVLKGPGEAPYIEISSMEGQIRNVERDKRGRAIAWLINRIDKDDVKCFARGRAQTTLERMEVGEVWRGVRVRVSGELKYKGLGRIEVINADYIEILDPDSELPSYEDIVDPDFTGGVETVEYLEKLRNGE